MTLPLGEEQLWEAWERVQENEGCAGADAVTVPQFAARAHKLIPALLERVDSGGYRPYPLLKIVVEKHSGHSGTRTLLVPAVRDRVLQTAVARHLSRSFEEEFLECSFGYRPGRSVDRAIARIRKCRDLGFVFVVDADIESFFDRVDHDLLLHRLGERQPGEMVMELLRLWVRAAVWDGSHVRSLRQGVPQGSPISPLLSNFFLEDFDRELEKSGRKLVRYADDFVILARSSEDAQRALSESGHLLDQSGLTFNQEKTHITDFEHGFKFLGAFFQGKAIWVPWKNERRSGRLLFMAPPLPLALRTRYEFAPPRNTLELAFEKASLTTAPPPSEHEIRSEPVAYLYLTEQGAILRKAGDRFLVEKDDEVLLDLPYHKLETVLLFGNIQVTTQALAELLEKGVNLSLFSRQGAYRGSLAPPRGRNIQLRVAQFRRYEDAPSALAIAQAVIAAKIANGIAVLDRYQERNETSAEFKERRQSLEDAVKACAATESVAALDGIEGAAAHAYFSAVMEFNKSGLEWPGRRKHPAPDPLNALLSLTYTLLMHELTALLEGAGLDPYLGFLHQIDYGRPSLALDLMEPFRHPAADRLVLTIVNRGMIGAEDFRPSGDGPGLFLSPGTMKKYFAEYERWMLERPTRQGEASASSFRDLLKAEVERLTAALRDNQPFEPFHFDDKKEQPACNSSSVTI
jgi:CRISP-associated protein Cas1